MAMEDREFKCSKRNLISHLIQCINGRTDLMWFGWFLTYEASYVRSSWPVAILTYYQHADEVVVHDSESRGALPRLFCRSMKLHPANVNFLDNTSFRFSLWIYIPPPELSAGKDRLRARRTSPDFISARYILF